MRRILSIAICILLLLNCFALSEGDAGAGGEAREAHIFVEAGYKHSFALGDDGTLWAWGVGEYGRLGTGGSSYLSIYDAKPVELENVVQASAGWYHSLFLTSDGDVYAAGCNYDYGQLGNGDGVDHSLPVRVLENAVQVEAGRDFSAALLSDGTLWTWGRNDLGQLGLGHTDAQTTPAQVELEGVVEIAMGESFLLARTRGGELYGWGDNQYAQVDDSGDASVSQPRRLEASGVVRIAAGNAHAMALTEEGEVLLWGDDIYGQLGGGQDAVNAFITESGVSVADIEAGGDASAMRSADGAWYLWGDLFGDAPAQDAKADVAGLSLGYWHALLVQEDGTLWGRGGNGSYLGPLPYTSDDIYKDWQTLELELLTQGEGGRSDAPVERDKAQPSRPFMAEVSPVAAGYYTSFAIAAGGEVWAWGRADYGQLGTGAQEDLDAPEKIDLDGVVQIAAGDYHTLFLRDNGELYGAGCSHDYDQLATGKFEDESSPVLIMRGIRRAWAGRDMSAAMDEDGAIWVWGANDLGQLGLGHTDAVDGPTKLALEGVVDMAVGKQFMAALDQDGNVWTWGDNTYGQLGVGEDVVATEPVRVELENIVSIAAGGAHMLALDADGRVWAWGAGYYGQHGVGGDSDRFTPVEVEGARGSVAVFAGGDTSGARLLGGDMLMWGAYFMDEPYVEEIYYFDYNREESVTLPIASVSFGSYHALAVDEAGDVYACGDDNFGQLGDGDADSYYPYLNWVYVSLDLEQSSYVAPRETPRPQSHSGQLL